MPGGGGSTWTFSFDAKQGDIGGASTALAFIKVLDPNAGFSLTDFITIDTTSLGDTWDTYSMSVFIDPGQAGQILQFGFLNVASNFDPSGVIYDNVNFTTVPVPAALWLFMSGIAGLAAMRKRKA